MKLFWCQEFFFGNFEFINGLKMNSRILMKNRVANPEIRFLTNDFIGIEFDNILQILKFKINLK